MPQILESLVQRQLQNRGFLDVDVNIDSVSTDEIAVDSIRFGATDNTWRVNGKNIVTSFDWRDLLRGNVQTISVKQLALNHTPLNTGQRNDFALQPLLLALSQSWQQQIPFDSLLVDRVDLYSSQTTPPIDASARLEVNKRAEDLHGEIEFVSDNGESRSLQLNWNEGKDLSLDFIPPFTAGSRPAYVEIKPVSSNQLAGEVKVDLDALREWASPLITVTKGLEAHGVLEVGFTIEEIAKGVSNLTLLGTGQNIQSFDVGLEYLQTSTNGILKQTDQGFEFTFTDDNHLQLQELSAGGAKLKRVRLQPGGSVHFADRTLFVKTNDDTRLHLQSLQHSQLSLQDATITWPGEVTIAPANINVATHREARFAVDALETNLIQIEKGAAAWEANIAKDANSLSVDLTSSHADFEQITIGNIKSGKLRSQLAGKLQVADDAFIVRFADTNTIDMKALVAEDWSVEKLNANLSGVVDGKKASLHWSDAETNVRFGGVKAFGYDIADGQLDWLGSFNNTNNGFVIDLQAGSAITLNTIDSEQLSMQSVHWPLSGSMHRSRDGVSLMVNSDSTITVSALQLADIDIPQATLKPGRQSVLAFTNEQRHWSLQSGPWSATMAPLVWQQFPITPEPITLDLSVNGGEGVRWSAQGVAQTGRVSTIVDGREAVLLDVETNMSVDNTKATADSEFSMLPDIGRITSELEYQIPDKQGRLKINTDTIDLGERELTLGDFWQPWPYPFDLVSGEISLTGDVRWGITDNQTNTNVQTKVSIEDGGGFLRDVLFSGLTAEIPIEIYPAIRTQHSAGVNVKQVDFGLPLNDVQAMVSLQPSAHGSLPALMAEAMSAGFLGGEIKSEKVHLDFNQERNQLVLTADSLNIEEMMRLQEFEGLAATGRVSGRIPIDIRPDGVHIEQGEVHALSPGGRINYAPEGGTQSIEDAAPGTEIVFQALKDFRYDVLTADTFYSPDGELLLKMHLEGTSPELETDRPVHVNINLEQNILSLLRSLRLVEGLNEKLDQRVREHYKSVQ